MGLKDIELLTIEDIKPIALSFKKNADELVLYKWILGHSGYSGFVKDNLRDVMNKEKNNKPHELTSNIKQNGLIDMDF